MKTTNWVVFGLMVLAQLTVPFVMIGSREQILEHGVAYTFRCGPVDPYDAFRGRYVALSFPNTQLEGWKGASFDGNEAAYALLGVDEEGFAKIVDVRLERPLSGDYLKVKAYGGGTADSVLWVTLPFDRYYMDEYQAPQADVALWGQGRTEDRANARVRVQEGDGVIEGLYIGDVSIEDFLRQEAAKAVTAVPAE